MLIFHSWLFTYFALWFSFVEVVILRDVRLFRFRKMTDGILCPILPFRDTLSYFDIASSSQQRRKAQTLWSCFSQSSSAIMAIVVAKIDVIRMSIPMHMFTTKVLRVLRILHKYRPSPTYPRHRFPPSLRDFCHLHVQRVNTKSVMPLILF